MKRIPLTSNWQRLSQQARKREEWQQTWVFPQELSAGTVKNIHLYALLSIIIIVSLTTSRQSTFWELLKIVRNSYATD